MHPRGSSREETVCAELAGEWTKLGHERSAESKKDQAARWGPVCVVRVATGSVGSRRSLGMTLAPARWAAWAEVVRDHRSVRGFPISIVDNAFEKEEHVARRPKPLSTGGGMEAFSSSHHADALIESVVL